MSTFSVLLISIASLGAAPQGELLDFSATWCGPCQQMSPIVSRLERQGFPIRRVDVDQNRELARRFRINSIPAFVLVVNGQEVTRIVGETSESSLRQLLAQIPAATPNETHVRNDQPAAAAPARIRPDESAAKRRSPEVPVVTVADGNKKTGLGLSLPFLGKKKDSTVQVDRSTPAVVRAKLDEGDAVASADGRRNAPAQPAASLALASSTRVRVKDRSGINFGSGTVVDSRPGRTLVLTCGHVFRELSETATVEVDVFRGGQNQTFVGKIVDFDLKADVGLVAIATDSPIPTAHVASDSAAPQRGNDVSSIGCGGGEPPTEQQLRITELNRYTGPDNIECTGVPVQGRSGGGLFNQRGEVIGVCIAADPKEKRGLYAGLKPIQQLLERVETGQVRRDAGQLNSPAVAEQRPNGRHLPTASDTEAPLRPANVQPVSLDTSRGAKTNDAVQEHRFDSNHLDEITEAMKSGDNEVICIVRPLADAKAASRVVIINRASPKFLSYLEGELDGQPRETMHSVKRSVEPAEDAPAAAADTTVKEGAAGWKRSRGSDLAHLATSTELAGGEKTRQRYQRSAKSR